MDENRKVIFAAGGFIILLGLILGGYFLFFNKSDEAVGPMETEVLEETSRPGDEIEAETMTGDTIQPLDMVLDESDSQIREMIAALSQHPELSRWLVTDDLIRKFVAAVDNIANGSSPRKHIDFFKPDEEFRTVQKNGREYVDPESANRYSIIAQVFSSLDAEGIFRMYRQVYPTIQEAYRDLGYPEGDFNSTLRRAVDELLGVPVVEGDIPLEAKLLSYAYADPDLEALSEAQKHLLRMGPANVRWIQTKLKEFKALLNP